MDDKTAYDWWEKIETALTPVFKQMSRGERRWFITQASWDPAIEAMIERVDTKIGTESSALMCRPPRHVYQPGELACTCTETTRTI